MKRDWNNLYKVRIASPDNSRIKHEVCKTILLMKLLNKHKKTKHWINIYTEFPLIEGRRADLVYMNTKDKSCYIYEIQKDYSKQWINEINEAYKNIELIGYNTVDLITIKLDDLSDNLNELSKQLDQYVL